MAIDGIGKPPGASIGGLESPSGLAGASGVESFGVERGTASTASAAPEPSSAALGGLQRGELSLDQYLDTRVLDATSHLSGKLSPEQLDFVKQSLREQLSTDPVLVALVKRTTESSPVAERP